MVYVVGHPNGSIEATTTIDARLVSVTGDEIDGLIEEYPYYTRSVIPGGLYRGNDEDVETFGVAATFVSSTAVDEDIVIGESSIRILIVSSACTRRLRTSTKKT